MKASQTKAVSAQPGTEATSLAYMLHTDIMGWFEQAQTLHRGGDHQGAMEVLGVIGRKAVIYPQGFDQLHQQVHESMVAAHA